MSTGGPAPHLASVRGIGNAERRSVGGPVEPRLPTRLHRRRCGVGPARRRDAAQRGIEAAVGRRMAEIGLPGQRLSVLEGGDVDAATGRLLTVAELQAALLAAQALAASRAGSRAAAQTGPAPAEPGLAAATSPETPADSADPMDPAGPPIIGALGVPLVAVAADVLATSEPAEPPGFVRRWAPWRR